VKEFRIGVAHAREKLDAGAAIALDVTSPALEASVHSQLPGAVRISPRQLLDTNLPAARVLARFRALQHGRTIIAYCT